MKFKNILSTLSIFYIVMLIFITFLNLFKDMSNALYYITSRVFCPDRLESQYTNTQVRISIPGSSAQHPKEGIDGCGRGVRTSIGTLASTKAHPPRAVEKRTARPVTTDNIFLPAILTLSRRLRVINFRVRLLL